MIRLGLGLFLFSLVGFVFLTGCQQSEVSAAGNEKPVVYVPVPPYKEIAQRIAGNAFEVRTLVSESDDPHVYSPTPKQVVSLAKAALLFTTEMPFEASLVDTLSASKTKVKVFSLTDQIELLEGSCELCAAAGNSDEEFVWEKGDDEHTHGEDDHDHDHDHHHHAHDMDPHVWLSPEILQAQSKTIASILKNAAPKEKGDMIDKNLEAVLADLQALDTQLAEKLAVMKGETFYVYHGAFAYFARRYGLIQETIELAGRRPEPKKLAELVEKAKKDKVRVVFVQPQFDQTSAKTLADSIGGKVLELDPLEQDVFANLDKIADSIGQLHSSSQP